MKASELTSKPTGELSKQLSQLTERIQELSSDLRVKEVKNVREIRSAKKDIARIKTVMQLQSQTEKGQS